MDETQLDELRHSILDGFIPASAIDVTASASALSIQP
jgi:hypothetical protein